MATLGIIGGIAPPSTVEYYKAVIEIYRRRTGGRAPHVLVNSIDGDEVIAHLSAGRHEELARLLSEGLRQLAAGGATVALLASASVHVAFERIRSDSPVPLIGIVAATIQASEGYRRLGLFATSFTAKADLFGPAFGALGTSVVNPTDAEQEEVHRIYFDELVRGQFLPRSRARLLAIAQRMRAEEDIDGVLLAGTELPLLLPDDAYGGIRFIDTGRAHVDAAVRAMLDETHADLPPS
jgi:aspartate racemase